MFYVTALSYTSYCVNSQISYTFDILKPDRFSKLDGKL